MQRKKFLQRSIREVSIGKIKHNFRLFLAERPHSLQYLVVAKNNGCGLGMQRLANLGQQFGAKYIALAAVEEAEQLNPMNIPLFLFGQRHASELEFCAQKEIHLQIQSLDTAKQYAAACARYQRPANIHVKIDTGLGRYGVPYLESSEFFAQLQTIPNINIVSIFSHFAQSDEWSKDFAYKQWNSFQIALSLSLPYCSKKPLIHMCNTGGYLDLPFFHADLCRLGILFAGTYPSKVCRRIIHDKETLQLPLRVISRVAFIQSVSVGSTVGYGMHFEAKRNSKIAVIPVGYGDGFPRLRNKGWVLINGEKAPIVGGVAMDCLMVDITDLPQVEQDDEVVLMGEQTNTQGIKHTITPETIAEWAQTVAYEVLTGWSDRTPLVEVQ